MQPFEVFTVDYIPKYNCISQRTRVRLHEHDNIYDRLSFAIFFFEGSIVLYDITIGNYWTILSLYVYLRFFMINIVLQHRVVPGGPSAGGIGCCDDCEAKRDEKTAGQKNLKKNVHREGLSEWGREDWDGGELIATAGRKRMGKENDLVSGVEGHVWWRSTPAAHSRPSTPWRRVGGTGRWSGCVWWEVR